MDFLSYILSNCGTSKVWKAFCEQLSIDMSMTSGYHPQANGQAEHKNPDLVILQQLRPAQCRDSS